MADFSERQRETEAYLARIRRAIAESSALVDAAELRIRETDRLLESQGLTREQVLGMRFTEDQRAAVNRELAHRGMEPLEEEDSHRGAEEAEAQSAESLRGSASSAPLCETSSPDERRKKFSAMMKPFRI